jgi:hypothetical protein
VAWQDRFSIFDYINWFDWKVVQEGDTDTSRCYIRFTVYEKPFRELVVCKKCGSITTEGGHIGNRSARYCPKCSSVYSEDCKEKRLSDEQYSQTNDEKI